MQSKVMICQAAGCPGTFVTKNPIVSTAHGYRAAEDLIIGGFCWEDENGYATCTGSGKPLGFICRDGIYAISRAYDESCGCVPKGENVCVALKGDFFAIPVFAAKLGQKVFACLLDGSLGVGDAGDEIEGYVETDYFYERSCGAGDITVISNWSGRGGASKIHKHVATAEEFVAALSDETVKTITLEDFMEASDAEVTSFCIISDKIIDLNGYGVHGLDGLEETCAALYCSGGTLTINGDGEVHGGLGCSDNVAVWADGDGKVIINGGNYDVGLDRNGKTNSTIYASNGAEIEINDGYFENEGADAVEAEYRYVLNIQNNSGSRITCYGGQYQNQNPADGDDKDTDTGATFLAEGYEIIEKKKDENMIYIVKIVE